jgi:hypothetical protein
VRSSMASARLRWGTQNIERAASPSPKDSINQKE